MTGGGIPGVGKFADELASKAAGRLGSVAAASAGGFAVVGAAAWSSAHGWVSGWRRIATALSVGSTADRFLMVAAAVVVLVLVGILSEVLALPVLRLLEGYWPRWLEPLRRPLVARARERAEEDAARLRDMAEADAAIGNDAMQQLLKRISELPARPELVMPTRLGNLLRAHETRPADSYGLDPVQLWTRLWLLLPDAATREITAARSRLDAAAVAWVWALLCGLWVFLAWWTLPLAIVAAWFCYRSILIPRGDAYGALVEAAFDLYRCRLYEAARWPLPETPAAEFASGQALSRFLIYGYAEPEARYTSPGASS